MRNLLHERKVHRCPGCGVVLLDRTQLNSSNIVAVGWEADEDNPQSGTLEVEFKRGIVYQYTGIPQFIYSGLLYAASAGKYFRQNIAEAFDGQRIE